MSDEQEMQFADPAWQPKVTQEFEANSPTPAPGASSSSAGAGSSFQSAQAKYDDYAHGYRPQSGPDAEHENPFQGQPQQPFQSQPQPSFQSLQDLFKRLPTWAWWVIGIVVLGTIIQPASSQGGPVGALVSLIFVGALVFVGWLLYTRRMRISLSGETRTEPTRTFTVGARPTIILKNKAGSINLRSGEEGQVGITISRRGYLFSPRFDQETPVTYNQDSVTNTVTARTGNWRPFGKNAITIDVVVPPQADLQLSTDFGSITVQNVAGQMTLRTDAGIIKATDVTLRGKSRLKGNAGTITFSGSLDPAGNYEIITDLGTIDATLSADVSCELTARTDIGTIATNLPLTQPQRNKAYGSVGIGPYPKLKIKTDVGTINIQRQ